jgi:hypothetical protein
MSIIVNHFENPELTSLKRKLDGIRMEEAAYKATGKDYTVSVTASPSVGFTRVFTRKGYCYSHDGQGDWTEVIPPVPGTGARVFYDRRRAIMAQIREFQLTGEIVPDDVKHLVDPVINFCPVCGGKYAHDHVCPPGTA